MASSNAQPLSPQEQQELEYLESLESQKQTKEQSAGDYASGALESLGQGLSLGYQDEMRAGLQSILPYGKPYQDELSAVRGQQSQFADQNPITDTGMKLAGNLVTGIASGGAGGNVIAREAALGGIEGFGSGTDSRLQDAALGAGFGAAFSKFGSLFGRPSASERVASGIGEIAERAEKRAGRRLITRAQEANSAIGKRIEAMTETLPFASGTKRIKENFSNELTSAAARSIEATSNKLTPDVLQASKNRISQKFTDAIGNKVLQVDEFAPATIQKIVDEYSSLPGSGNTIKRIGEDLAEELSGGTMTADRYQDLSSYLGAKIKSASKAAGKSEQLEPLWKMKDSLDDIVEASDVADLGQFKEARKLYKSFMALTKNRHVIDPTSGEVSGKRLFGELAKQDKAYNVAGTELGDLATLSTIKGVGDSGTANRLLLPLAGMGAMAGYGDLSGSILGSIGATRVVDELAQNVTSEGAGMLGGAISRARE